MCGRYTISIDEQEIRDIVNAITQQHPNTEVKTGEIYPTNPAPVLLAGQDDIRPDVAVWGFPNFRSKGVIINARAETALNKKAFRESLLTHRQEIGDWIRNETAMGKNIRARTANLDISAGIDNRPHLRSGVGLGIM